MKAQEVITVIAEIPAESIRQTDPLIKTYPELDALFEKGMYIESLTQTHISNKTYIITFVFRNYNAAQTNE